MIIEYLLKNYLKENIKKGKCIYFCILIYKKEAMMKESSSPAQ
jgi:hypothetical protein